MRYRARPDGEGSVVALFNGESERFLLESFALLLQEFPRVGGPAFQHAITRLRARFGEPAVAMLQDSVVLLSEMRVAGRLPRLRLGRARSAGKDEIFFIAMLAALQRGDNGRAIEAAIALLDSGHVYAVIGAARALAQRLVRLGLVLRQVQSPLFDYFAGYPVIAEAPSVADTLAEVSRPRRPVLRLLKSA
ncbi:MAG TPA: hypothetical protein VHG27_09530 [Xanthobacteraceae bacterium]|nr:hypothetical protein [Xanthobacteraceae bacterium]